LQLANHAHSFCVGLGINLTWQSRWPGAVVATFGSLAASLSTFLSDIDVTVCDAQQARQHQEDKSGTSGPA
jgi:DNA polymerase sigma